MAETVNTKNQDDGLVIIFLAGIIRGINSSNFGDIFTSLPKIYLHSGLTIKGIEQRKCHL